jgi:hypothetical protein
MTLLRTSAGKCQQPILHVLDKRLAAPAGELPANSEGTALTRSSAASQLDQINHLVQHGARLLGVVLEDEGRREVGQDHRLVLLLARTQALRGVLKRCLGSRGVVQAKKAGADEAAELFPAKDSEHWVVGGDLRQVVVGALQELPGLPLLTNQRMRLGGEGRRPAGNNVTRAICCRVVACSARYSPF